MRVRAREMSRASRTVRPVSAVTGGSGLRQAQASSVPDLLLRLTGRLVKGCRSRPTVTGPAAVERSLVRRGQREHGIDEVGVLLDPVLELAEGVGDVRLGLLTGQVDARHEQQLAGTDELQPEVGDLVDLGHRLEVAEHPLADAPVCSPARSGTTGCG